MNYKITYPPELPISREIESIKKIVSKHQVVIICGETGSGKTTQLPKMLLEMGYAADSKIIGHTQPRRVAAKTIAHRISFELNNADVVAYKIRFSDKTKPETSIKLMTDGILLQEIQTDRQLNKYSALIIDEAHERSLNIDFILGYLKTLLVKRPDLKVIITSATIDNQKLAKFFNDVPVINVEGKTHPVDIIYQPTNLDEDNLTLNNAIYQAITACLNVDQGNVIVFLPGEREIKDCIHFLRKTTLKRYQILSLFSRQSEKEQNLVFTENGELKIIVTTNVAETSLTIPGVKFVVDSGIARVKRYNVRTKVEQLLIENISQASSTQRAGRAGRVSHGMCVRLFSEQDFKLRPLFTDPEVMRSNLANVILRLISLRLGDPLTFPFLDMPETKSFNDGFRGLFQLGAIDANNMITPLGRQMAKIPLDTNLARILLAAKDYNCLNETLVITSFLAVIDPREVPSEYQAQAREKHSIWKDKQSDFIAIINLWQWYQEQLLHKKSNKQLSEKCYTNFLSSLRLREWHESHSQLLSIMHNLDYTENKTPANYQQIHQAILTGLLSNIGQKDLVEDSYVGTNSKRFILHPSSEITRPKWVVAASLTQTTRLYARINAYVEPKWLVPITTHLVKYTYSGEHWDKKRGEVIAVEHVIYSGLTLDKRSIGFSKIDPVLAHEVFIKQGVVLGELGKNYGFLEHNQQVIDKLTQLEDKLRLSLIVAEEELLKFYETHIPVDVYDIRTFDVWLKDNEPTLFIQEGDLIRKVVTENDAITLYPDYLIISGHKLKVNYIFNPDHELDGATATIFLTRLNQIPDNSFDWLVPGLIREKIAIIIKLLPKNVRVAVNPVNEFISDFLTWADQTNNFNQNLSSYLKQQYSLEIKVDDIGKICLPRHLVMHLQIIDGGQILATNDNLSVLKKQLASSLKDLVGSISSSYEITNINTWQKELEQLLETIEMSQHKQKVLGYLSLLVRANQVDLKVVDSLDKALISTRVGLLQLIKNQLDEQLKYLTNKPFENFNQTSIFLADIYTSSDLLMDSIDFIIRMSVNLTIIPKTELEFATLVLKAKSDVGQNSLDFARTLYLIAKLYHGVKLKIKNHPLEAEILLQLDDLIYPQFLRYTRFSILEHFTRYLTAIEIRLDKYLNNKVRDTEIAHEISTLYDAWYNRVEELEEAGKKISQPVYNFKYKIEELRVSLFAQTLKTQYPVSAKRLWRELHAM